VAAQPIIPFGTLRSLGGQIKWADNRYPAIRTSMAITTQGSSDQPGYSWTQFTNGFVQLQSGQNVMFNVVRYRVGHPPAAKLYHSGNPPGCTGPPDTNAPFKRQTNGPGICETAHRPMPMEPATITIDRLHYALHAHVCPILTHEWIQYWEVWNEPNIEHRVVNSH